MSVRLPPEAFGSSVRFTSKRRVAMMRRAAANICFCVRISKLSRFPLSKILDLIADLDDNHEVIFLKNQFSNLRERHEKSAKHTTLSIK